MSYLLDTNVISEVRKRKRDKSMKDEYDLAAMKSRPNPYAERFKKQISLPVSDDVIDYFKEMEQETGVPYQTLINLYLRDCVANHRKLEMRWAS